MTEDTTTVGTFRDRYRQLRRVGYTRVGAAVIAWMFNGLEDVQGMGFNAEDPHKWRSE